METSESLFREPGNPHDLPFRVHLRFVPQVEHSRDHILKKAATRGMRDGIGEDFALISAIRLLLHFNQIDLEECVIAEALTEN
jgi:hypothetical protein